MRLLISRITNHAVVALFDLAGCVSSLATKPLNYVASARDAVVLFSSSSSVGRAPAASLPLMVAVVIAVVETCLVIGCVCSLLNDDSAAAAVVSMETNR